MKSISKFFQHFRKKKSKSSKSGKVQPNLVETVSAESTNDEVILDEQIFDHAKIHIQDPTLNLKFVNEFGNSVNCKMSSMSSGRDALGEAKSSFSKINKDFQLRTKDADFRLHRVKTLQELNLDDVLDMSGVQNYDEIYLRQIKKSSEHYDKDHENSAPTQEDIDEATINESLNPDVATNLTNKVQTHKTLADIEDHIYQNSEAIIRRLFKYLAEQSAYIIGCGPYAKGLIEILRARLQTQSRDKFNAMQSMLDMGFSYKKCRTALRIHGNIYSDALNWLIETQNDVSLRCASRMSTQLSQLSIGGLNCTAENIKNIRTLLKIIEINSEKKAAPVQDQIQIMEEMGFQRNNIIEALANANNDVEAACNWLCGDRMLEQRVESLTSNSPIIQILMNSSDFQLGLGNPKIFLAYISILDNYLSTLMWLQDQDSELSTNIEFVLKTFYQTKHVESIEQFNPGFNMN